MKAFVIALSCRDRPGLVAAVSGLLFDCGGNILEAQQFDDRQTRQFFMRIVVDLPDDGAETRRRMRDLAPGLGMSWRMRRVGDRQRTLLIVSKFDHCLGDLLYRARIGELAMDPVGIVSNHPRAALNIALFDDVPFHHLPIVAGEKRIQELEIQRLVEDTQAELVILARYMQILSDELAGFLSGRCINIHHSFLPGFKGAKPYHQAHARGVKMIGASAHYVTADLDEGPIIVQDVEPISHADTPDDLVRKGRDIERRVLAKAVHHHLEDRVLINGAKTVVFAD